jgi:hypothetical protein
MDDIKAWVKYAWFRVRLWAKDFFTGPAAKRHAKNVSFALSLFAFGLLGWAVYRAFFPNEIIQALLSSQTESTSETDDAGASYMTKGTVSDIVDVCADEGKTFFYTKNNTIGSKYKEEKDANGNNVYVLSENLEVGTTGKYIYNPSHKDGQGDLVEFFFIDTNDDKVFDPSVDVVVGDDGTCKIWSTVDLGNKDNYEFVSSGTEETVYVAEHWVTVGGTDVGTDSANTTTKPRFAFILGFSGNNIAGGNSNWVKSTATDSPIIRFFSIMRSANVIGTADPDYKDKHKLAFDSAEDAMVYLFGTKLPDGTSNYKGDSEFYQNVLSQVYSEEDQESVDSMAGAFVYQKAAPDAAEYTFTYNNYVSNNGLVYIEGVPHWYPYVISKSETVDSNGRLSVGYNVYIGLPEMGDNLCSYNNDTGKCEAIANQTGILFGSYTEGNYRYGTKLVSMYGSDETDDMFADKDALVSDDSTTEYIEGTYEALMELLQKRSEGGTARLLTPTSSYAEDGYVYYLYRKTDLEAASAGKDEAGILHFDGLDIMEVKNIATGKEKYYLVDGGKTDDEIVNQRNVLTEEIAEKGLSADMARFDSHKLYSGIEIKGYYVNVYSDAFNKKTSNNVTSVTGYFIPTSEYSFDDASLSQYVRNHGETLTSDMEDGSFSTSSVNEGSVTFFGQTMIIGADTDAFKTSGYQSLKGFSIGKSETISGVGDSVLKLLVRGDSTTFGMYIYFAIDTESKQVIGTNGSKIKENETGTAKLYGFWGNSYETAIVKGGVTYIPVSRPVLDSGKSYAGKYGIPSSCTSTIDCGFISPASAVLAAKTAKIKKIEGSETTEHIAKVTDNNQHVFEIVNADIVFDYYATDAQNTISMKAYSIYEKKTNKEANITGAFDYFSFIGGNGFFDSFNFIFTQTGYDNYYGSNSYLSANQYAALDTPTNKVLIWNGAYSVWRLYGNSVFRFQDVVVGSEDEKTGSSTSVSYSSDKLYAGLPLLALVNGDTMNVASSDGTIKNVAMNTYDVPEFLMINTGKKTADIVGEEQLYSVKTSDGVPQTWSYTTIGASATKTTATMYSYDIYALTSYDSDLTGEVNYQSRVEEIANMVAESYNYMSGATKKAEESSSGDSVSLIASGSPSKVDNLTQWISGYNASGNVISKDAYQSKSCSGDPCEAKYPGLSYLLTTASGRAAIFRSNYVSFDFNEPADFPSSASVLTVKETYTADDEENGDYTYLTNAVLGTDSNGSAVIYSSNETVSQAIKNQKGENDYVFVELGDVQLAYRKLTNVSFIRGGRTAVSSAVQNSNYDLLVRETCSTTESSGDVFANMFDGCTMGFDTKFKKMLAVDVREDARTTLASLTFYEVDSNGKLALATTKNANGGKYEDLSNKIDNASYAGKLSFASYQFEYPTSGLNYGGSQQSVPLATLFGLDAVIKYVYSGLDASGIAFFASLINNPGKEGFVEQGWNSSVFGKNATKMFFMGELKIYGNSYGGGVVQDGKTVYAYSLPQKETNQFTFNGEIYSGNGTCGTENVYGSTGDTKSVLCHRTGNADGTADIRTMSFYQSITSYVYVNSAYSQNIRPVNHIYTSTAADATALNVKNDDIKVLRTETLATQLINSQEYSTIDVANSALPNGSGFSPQFGFNEKNVRDVQYFAENLFYSIGIAGYYSSLSDENGRVSSVSIDEKINETNAGYVFDESKNPRVFSNRLVSGSFESTGSGSARFYNKQTTNPIAYMSGLENEYGGSFSYGGSSYLMDLSFNYMIYGALDKIFTRSTDGSLLVPSGETCQQTSSSSSSNDSETSSESSSSESSSSESSSKSSSGSSSLNTCGYKTVTTNFSSKALISAVMIKRKSGVFGGSVNDSNSVIPVGLNEMNGESLGNDIYYYDANSYLSGGVNLIFHNRNGSTEKDFEINQNNGIYVALSGLKKGYKKVKTDKMFSSDSGMKAADVIADLDDKETTDVTYWMKASSSGTTELKVSVARDIIGEKTLTSASSLAGIVKPGKAAATMASIAGNNEKDDITAKGAESNWAKNMVNMLSSENRINGLASQTTYSYDYAVFANGLSGEYAGLEVQVYDTSYDISKNPVTTLATNGTVKLNGYAAEQIDVAHGAERNGESEVKSLEYDLVDKETSPSEWMVVGKAYELTLNDLKPNSIYTIVTRIRYYDGSVSTADASYVRNVSVDGGFVNNPYGYSLLNNSEVNTYGDTMGKIATDNFDKGWWVLPYVPTEYAKCFFSYNSEDVVIDGSTDTQIVAGGARDQSIVFAENTSMLNVCKAIPAKYRLHVVKNGSDVNGTFLKVTSGNGSNLDPTKYSLTLDVNGKTDSADTPLYDASNTTSSPIRVGNESSGYEVYAAGDTRIGNNVLNSTDMEDQYALLFDVPVAKNDKTIWTERNGKAGKEIGALASYLHWRNTDSYTGDPVNDYVFASTKNSEGASVPNFNIRLTCGSTSSCPTSLIGKEYEVEYNTIKVADGVYTYLDYDQNGELTDGTLKTVVVEYNTDGTPKTYGSGFYRQDGTTELMETESLLTFSGSTKGTRTVAEFDKSGRKWRTVTSGVTGETAKFRIVSNDGTFYLALVLGDGSTSIVK